MSYNEVYHRSWLDNNLPDKCAGLIVADPPYYGIKGDFDFIWPSFDRYLKDVELWAAEYKRVLADNGTLFCYGDRLNIAYTQVILDKLFNLESNITIRIINKQSQRVKPDDARSFLNVTERLLMYSNEIDFTGLQYVEKEFVAPRNPFAIELRRARAEAGLSVKDVAEAGKFYGNINHGGAVTNWEKGLNVPLPDQWAKLCEILPICHGGGYSDIKQQYEAIRAEYDQVRQEYEHKRRYFEPLEKYKTDVWDFTSESHNTAQYGHDTVKGEKLTRMLINACSRPGDLVVVPFAGSGTECAMAGYEGREFAGFEIDKKHVDTANKRCQLIISKPGLF